jgi:polyisoprenoid-binding protein YceI
MAQWNIDPAHSSADFTVRHMMVTNVRGTFDQLSGTIEFDPKNRATASVEATIDVASISTRAADRDNHLRSADFFAVEQFPHIHFKSTSVEIDGDTARVHGDLTIKDTTRPVTLDVEYLGQMASPFGDQRVGFTASTKIKREDFGLTWNVALETGGVLVGSEVRIELDVQGILVTETAPA